jgi:predicted nuclease with TOPRIM domain
VLAKREVRMVQSLDVAKGLAEKEANEKKLKAAPLKEYGRVAQLMDLRRRLADERKKLDVPKEAKNREKLQKNIDKFEKDETKRLAEIKKLKLKLDAPEVKEYLRLQDAIRAFDQKWKKVSLFEAFVDQDDPKLIADARPPAIEAWTSSDVQEKSDKLGSVLDLWKNKTQAKECSA